MQDDVHADGRQGLVDAEHARGRSFPVLTWIIRDNAVAVDRSQLHDVPDDSVDEGKEAAVFGQMDEKGILVGQIGKVGGVECLLCAIKVRCDESVLEDEVALGFEVNFLLFSHLRVCFELFGARTQKVV